MIDASKPEPDQLARAISQNLGWGPLNCGAGIRANFHCEYCGKNMLESPEAYYSWEIDHITPGAGDELENLALSCRTCNHLKHTYRPVGGSREERIANAWRQIQAKLQRKAQELERLREIVNSVQAGQS